ncbi:NarK/NasA family nitrate transporter [Lactobacillus sp. CC-MHH1034]|uniref:nitrate/nitrite transporter n=1 Tax=Agrilactobacillus fermenti TaxID=2586909 RepID=UPI001E28C571|nr:nitrate/nitrite transporter [Agrilactobacillus fermenti]MCD2255661.1 NarK/NasA family nitrate transporter [Agrilactobacillus fermenti]
MEKSNKTAAIMALVMGTLAMLVSFMAWSSLAPLANQITKMLSLSVSQKTFMIATPVLLGSIMRIPMGYLSDRFGGKKIYIALMIFVLIPLFLIPMALNSGSFGLLIFLAFLLGMSGTSFAVAISYVSVWYPPEKQGLVLGIASVGNIGNAVAALTLPKISQSYNLSTVYYFLMVLLVIMIVLFFIFCKEMPTNKDKTLGQAFVVAKEANTWYLSLFYFLTFGLFVSLSNLLPALLSDQFQVNQINAGLWAAVFAAVATLVRPIGGSIADKVNPMKLLQVLFTLMALTGLLMAFALDSLGLFMTGIIVVAVLAGLGNGIVFKMVPFVSKGNTGTVTGFVGAIGGLGGYFPPLVMGVIKQQTGSYQIGFFLLVTVVLICWGVLYKAFIKSGNSDFN